MVICGLWREYYLRLVGNTALLCAHVISSPELNVNKTMSTVICRRHLPHENLNIKFIEKQESPIQDTGPRMFIMMKQYHGDKQQLFTGHKI